MSGTSSPSLAPGTSISHQDNTSSHNHTLAPHNTFAPHTSNMSKNSLTQLQPPTNHQSWTPIQSRDPTFTSYTLTKSLEPKMGTKRKLIADGKPVAKKQRTDKDAKPQMGIKRKLDADGNKVTKKQKTDAKGKAKKEDSVSLLITSFWTC